MFEASVRISGEYQAVPPPHREEEQSDRRNHRSLCSNQPKIRSSHITKLSTSPASVMLLGEMINCTSILPAAQSFCSSIASDALTIPRPPATTRTGHFNCRSNRKRRAAIKSSFGVFGTPETHSTAAIVRAQLHSPPSQTAAATRLSDTARSVVKADPIVSPYTAMRVTSTSSRVDR